MSIKLSAGYSPITQSLLDATLANLLNETFFGQLPCFPETAKYLGLANFKQFVLIQLIHSKTAKCHLGLIDCKLYLAPSPVRHQIYKTTNLPKLYYCSIACGICTGQFTV